MSDQLRILLLSSILLPAFISITKFRSLDKYYLPFIFFLWVSLLIDFIDSIVSVKYGIICTNIYYLLESIFILWQFQKWRTFKDNKNTIYLLYISFALIWILEFCYTLFIIYSKRDYFHLSYFTCLYSLLFTIFSINRITLLSTSTEGSIIKHPLFIICAAFILYYSYSCIMAVFYIPALEIKLIPFYKSVYPIMFFILFFCNLLYTYAIIQMIKPNPLLEKHKDFFRNSKQQPSII